jgi:hypothetical protein
LGTHLEQYARGRVEKAIKMLAQSGWLDGWEKLVPRDSRLL